jgi:hypothetical protein
MVVGIPISRAIDVAKLRERKGKLAPGQMAQSSVVLPASRVGVGTIGGAGHLCLTPVRMPREAAQ